MSEYSTNDPNNPLIMPGGLVLEPRPAKGWVFGGVTGVTERLKFPPWKPTPWFSQVWHDRDGKVVDTYGCVSNSAVTSIEEELNTLFTSLTSDAQSFLVKNGYLVNGKVRLSRRVVVKLSGTKPGYGNSLFKVAETIRAYFRDAEGKPIGLLLVPEAVWPWQEGMTEEEYYSDIPEAVMAKIEALAREFLVHFDYAYEWVNPDDHTLSEMLQYGIVQGCVRMGWPDTSQLWHRAQGESNHAIANYAVEQDGVNDICDSYKSYGSFLKRLHPSFEVDSTMLHTITPKTLKQPTMVDNYKNGDLVALQHKAGIVPVVKLGDKFRLIDTFEKLALAGGSTGSPLAFQHAEMVEGTDIYDFKGNKVKTLSGGVLCEVATLGISDTPVEPVSLWAGLSEANKKRIVSFTRVFLSTFLTLAGAQLALGYPPDWTAWGALVASCVSAAFKEGIDYIVKK